MQALPDPERARHGGPLFALTVSTNRTIPKQSLLPGFLLPALLGLTIFVLWPALQGGFLFDDYVNLNALGDSGSVHDWETLRAYLTGGLSGPTGRPISLLTFLLDGNTWPAPAAPFKYTNLMLHLLAGALLIWASLQLCRFYGVPEREAQYFALFNGAAWLLHPFLLSTPFYVVQRMAVLAALFCFAGIAAYLYGRRLQATRPTAGLLWMTGGIGLGTLLATLSKENGALLPLLILVIEFCRPNTVAPPPRWFRILFLYLPSLALLGYLVRHIDFSPDLWSMRPFNQPERLLTEARILWDYLGNLLLPRIEGAGLYQDGQVISRGWLQPPTTLLAVAGLIGLLGTALALRRRWPLLALAILFFLAGHLLESTVIGLELYFEHRNYLPAAFLFLPLAQGLTRLPRVSPQLRGGLALGVLILFAFLGHQRAQLWGDPQRLDLYWALAAPDSARAQNTLASYYLRHGEPERAFAIIQTAMQRIPDNPLLSVVDLLNRLKANRATESDFRLAAERLARQPIDGQSIKGLREIVNLVIRDARLARLVPPTLELLTQLGRDSQYGKVPLARRILPYLEAKIYLAQGDSATAEDRYLTAMRRYGDIDAALQMVAEMATSGQPARALRLLNAAETLYHTQAESSLRFPRGYYAREIPLLRDKLVQAAKSPLGRGAKAVTTKREAVGELKPVHSPNPS